MVTRNKPAPPQVLTYAEAAALPPAATLAEVASSANPLEVGGPLPKSVGRCADLYSEVRGLRLQMDKEVDAVKTREAEIREHIINNLSKSDDSGAAGLKYRAQIVMKDVPRVTDWTKLWAFIAKNNRFDLLQKRLGEKACSDMMEAGETPPGTELMHIPEVSITKI